MSFADPLNTGGITLTMPATDTSVPVNPLSGRAYDMTFSWNRFSSDRIITCDIQVATDPAFNARIVDAWRTNITTDTISAIIGPTGLIQSAFMPNTTYYWRIRVSGITDGPWYSPWSETRSFTVEGEIGFAIVSPDIGATGVALTPSLSWTEYAGAISYEVAVAEDPTFAILDVSHSADYNFYYVEEPLKYSTTYYWRVRAVTGPAQPKMPAPGSDWAEGVFTTMAEPVEEEPQIIVIPEPAPPAPPPEIIEITKEVEAPIPDYLLWTIVGIGAVLIIALIVLIARTRRVV
jgi:hypothetical protein